MKPTALVTAVLTSLAVAGCSGFFMPVDKLRPRAAYDMKCADAELQFVELSGDCGKKLADAYNCTIGVRGCGQQATYLHVPGGDWVMNSTASSSQPAAKP